VLRTLLVAAVVVGAALFVSVFAIDLGPSLKAHAEREATVRIKRPMHIGKLSVRLLSGRFVLDDVVIEGLTPKSRPFLVARRVEVALPWWTAFRRELLLESIAMTDWKMYIETFPDGRHNFPKFPTPKRSTGQRRFVTTLRSVKATGGTFTYVDHGTPWGVDTPAMDILVTKADRYRGRASFRDGTIRIQEFVPMWAHMRSSFVIEGGLVHLDRINLETDGARSELTGTVNLGRWPEQVYGIDSHVSFPRQKELFFSRQAFRLAGDGRFRGTFRLFRGGRELKGTFQSAHARVNDHQFNQLRGSLLWTRDRFEVSNAEAALYGGATRFNYSIAPLGTTRPAIVRFTAKYGDVDLEAYSDAIDLNGMKLGGRATGENALEYPLRRFQDRRGGGHVTVAAPAGVVTQGPELSRTMALEPAAGGGRRPFDRDTPLGRLPIHGALAYRFGPEWIDLERGELATPSTYVTFSGRTAYGGDSGIDFHVTSGDWQESDRVLAGLMTVFGNPTRPVEVGGAGTFDGTLTGLLGRPRVEGRFSGSGLRAWDVVWGNGRGEVVVENGYAVVSKSALSHGGATIEADGRFSLGFPRRDGGEELSARVRIAGRPVADLRHAFELDDYPIDGRLSGEFHLYGRYQRPHGYGRMSIDHGTAYGEPIDHAQATLRFEGTGLRLDGLEMRKAAGSITGAAYVGWDGTYSFDVDAQRIPVESVAALRFERVPLSGQLQFTASGSGRFASPSYTVRASIDDLHAGAEQVGQVRGRLTVRDDVLTIEQLEGASARLAISGAGKIALTEAAAADLNFRFNNTSVDPYARLLYPNLSPFTMAVASGTVHVTGDLRRLEGLRADGRVDRLDLRFFDYRIANDGPIRLAVEGKTLRVDRLRVVGDGTAVEMAGDVRLDTRRLNLGILGDANLSILQGFVKDLRSSGSAEIQAVVSGTLDAPDIVGTALVDNGRVRHFSLPHAVEALNGRVAFDRRGISLDGLTGRMGSGDVRFGGLVAVKGFAIDEYNVTARGTGMRVRYPESFRSVVDADLSLRGRASAPTLGGRVLVRDALLVRTIDTSGTGVFGLTAVGGGAARAPTPVKEPEPRVPLRFDIRIEAPGTIRIDSGDVRLTSNADLTLGGSYEKPQLFGRVEVVRGEIFAEGHRYTLNHGAVSFSNPSKIEPFFDAEAETRAQVPGQVYQVTLRVSGTPESFVFELSSDPPLSEVDILALLFGDTRDPQNAELRALRAPNQTEQELIASRAARLLASPLSTEVSRVAERALGVDTVLITPSLGDLSSETSARLTPGARLTIGKRISDRLFLSYARVLTSTRRDQLILLEFNQSDRLSWVISQNEDATYAIDLRVRHVF
jgi:TamB, inner membrane protein subunit of TAM complex